jgi:hypothetical protein
VDEVRRQAEDVEDHLSCSLPSRFLVFGCVCLVLTSASSRAESREVQIRFFDVLLLMSKYTQKSSRKQLFEVFLFSSKYNF